MSKKLEMVVSAALYEAGLQLAANNEDGYKLENGALYYQGVIVRPKGEVYKTNGKSEFVLVDDPDAFNLDGRKVRHKPTNITPPKKKRRK